MGARTQRIYLDNLATTPTDPRVAEVVVHFMCEAFGNASSADHEFGDDAASAVVTARSIVARFLGVTPQTVLFTSGSTESVNLVLQGFANWPARKTRLRVLTLATEHSAVLDTCSALARAGKADVRFLRVDSLGRLDLNELESLARGTDLVCAMAANNEVGTIHPTDLIAATCRRLGVAFLCDATQAVGKLPLHLDDRTILAFTAHKIYGPKGAGALILPNDLPIQPMLFGGGQQKGMRSGTLNVPGIAGLAEAVRLRDNEMSEDERRIGRLRDEFQLRLGHDIPGLVVNGDVSNRLAGCLNVSIPTVPNDAIVARLRDRVAISTGAACSSGSLGPSHVLRAMGLPSTLMGGALRISLGKFTSATDVDQAATEIVKAAFAVRAAMVA